MKAGLEFLFATFSLVAVAQAKYDLSCSKSELSIRWPSYESNSEYYICSRLHGRQMTVACSPGEVFTFVLQSCTRPNKYIPAPALKALPTASPLISKPNEDGFLTPLEIVNQPPVLGPPTINPPSIYPPSINHPPISQPPMGPPTIHLPPIISDTKPVDKEANAISIVEETAKPLAPLPPTPAPTPPVLHKETNKKPSASGKKPSTNKKKKTVVTNGTISGVGKKTSKKPSSASGKKTPAKKKNGKSSTANNVGKKPAKKANGTDKKAPKA